MRRKNELTALVLTIVVVATSSPAGIRAPGKYCGAVFFDRWGGCYLYSGIYLTYVSESIKDELRSHAGEWVQVDATEVWQPINPGDARINKIRSVAGAPAGRNWVALDGIVLRAESEQDARTP
jgi:hypothetical protein